MKLVEPLVQLDHHPECPSAPLAWVSDDGVTWQSAYPGPQPAEPPDHNQGSEFVAAWSVPTGGWDAAQSYWEGITLTGRNLWHSGDGLAWTALEPGPAPDLGDQADSRPWVHAAAADPEGWRVLWQQWSDYSDPLPSGAGTSVMTLATSPDGRSWTNVEGFPGRSAEIAAGLAPDGSRTRWVLTGASDIADDYSSVPTVLASEDRVQWSATVLPTVHGSRVGGVTSVVLAQRGYVAVRAVFDGYAADNWTWLSEDGLAWVEVPPIGTPGAGLGPRRVADGPAGVIGSGWSPTNPDTEAAVWQLR